MKTLFDVVSLILFAGLAVLFLQRSTSNEDDPVALWKYGVAAVGCAVADYLGNQGQAIAAIIIFVLDVAFSAFMLNPFSRSTRK